MKNFVTLWCALFLCTHVLWAQPNRPQPTTLPLAQVATLRLPALNNKALAEAERAEWTRKDRAPHFAVNRAVLLDIQHDGTWETLSPALAVWRMRIVSEGALSLNFGFTKYQLPADAHLIIYSADQRNMIGPFTLADNEEHEQLWTPILEADDVIIEVQVPTAQKSEVQLQLTSVNHDFLGFAKMASSVASGSCNVDVICGAANGFPQIEPHRDIIQSVAVIGMQGSTFCTGFLVNNVRQDCTPFFMTANHCGVNNGNAATLVAYWNFQNSTCRPPNSPASGGAGDGVLTDFNTGAIFKAGYDPSDMTLVELDDPVSETSNAYFAGWNAIDAPATSGVCIHHPNTDEKRITFFDTPAVSDSWASTPNSHWNVLWSLGVTEPGSSGSPLYDQNERIIGQLSGGPSSCSATGADRSDVYGKFSLSWTGGGTNATRLSNWLDPDNTGALVLDGKYLQGCGYYVEPLVSAPIPLCTPSTQTVLARVSDNFVNPVTITTPNIPAGVQVTYSANPANPGDTIVLTISFAPTVVMGAQTLTFAATDGINNSTNALAFLVSNAPPTSPLLLSPAENATNQPTNVNLTWQNVAAAQVTYSVQVINTNGTMVYNVTNLTNPGATVNNLSPLTTYQWRVRATNGCGNSEWSGYYTFTTGNIQCTTYSSTNVPLVIDDGVPSTITSTLTVAEEGIITDVNVSQLLGTHSYVGDLEISLTSPSGTTVVLVGNICGSDENFNVQLDDAATAALPCPYNDGGTYRPDSPLGAFNGQQMQGVWTLSISDNAFIDGGALTNWGLTICGIAQPNYDIFTPSANLSLCLADSVLTFPVIIGGAYTEPVHILVQTTPIVSLINISTEPVSGGDTAYVAIQFANIGTYDVAVIAFDNAGHGDTIMMTVNVLGQPAPFSLLTPQYGSTWVEASSIDFTWTMSDSSASYILQVSTDTLFTVFAMTQTTSDTSATHVELDFNTTYYWRVLAVNACGFILPTQHYNTFTTGRFVSSVSPTFVNACAPTLVAIEVRVATNNDGSNPVSITVSALPSGITVTQSPPNPIIGFTTAFVVLQIGAQTPIGTHEVMVSVSDSDTSIVYPITLAVQQTPPQPILLSPLDGITWPFDVALPSFEWNNPSEMQVFEMATNTSFTNIIHSANLGLVNNYTLPEGTLSYGQQYYWRVRPLNTACPVQPAAYFAFFLEPVSTQEIAGIPFSIYPNPAHQAVVIQAEAPLSEALSLTLLDLSGRVVQTQSALHGQRWVLATEALQNGMYIVQLQTEKATAKSKIVIQH